MTSQDELLGDMAMMLAAAAVLMSDETATCGQAAVWCRLAADLIAKYERAKLAPVTP